MDLQYILSPTDAPPPPPAPGPAAAPHVHPNPDDAIISFDGKTRSFPKPAKPPAPAAADPYAEHFLRDMLGPDKWRTFSTRLFERRLAHKGRPAAADDDPKASGASAVEFLVKVEVVKAILRECVPHPYNPRKSLSHPFPAAPSGHVTLTRSTVLLLCGWSNTQFSYWARRSEAVSVLAEHDPRLRAVAAALARRLRPADDPDPDPDPDHDDAAAAAVTGKGLDTIIEDVKKRTGKSQFLRGKHSSLDPFGTAPSDPAAPPPPPQYAMPTFQAERYDHAATGVPHLDAPPAAATRRARARPASPRPKRKLAPLPQPPPAPARKPAPAAAGTAHHFPVSDSRSEVDDDAAPTKRARTGAA